MHLHAVTQSTDMGTEELSDVVAHLVCFCFSCSYRKFERVNSTAIPMAELSHVNNQKFQTNIF